MIPVGYMAKNIESRPDWLKTNAINDIYSVSGCISEDFADYINYWKHNGYWFFDSADVIESIAASEGIDLSATTLFFYEVYEKQYDDVKNKWQAFAPEKSFATHVQNPVNKHLEGYDVVSFSGQTSAECSPLSCNSMAQNFSVNAHCLFETFDEAKLHVENGDFKNCEPGPYRIFAVYTVNNTEANEATPAIKGANQRS